MTDVSKVPFRTFNVSKGTFRTSPPPGGPSKLAAVLE
jgi:hypothetical protein